MYDISIYFEAGGAYFAGKRVIPVCCRTLSISELGKPMEWLQAIEGSKMAMRPEWNRIHGQCNQQATFSTTWPSLPEPVLDAASQFGQRSEG
jgi:hypothetical protein